MPDYNVKVVEFVIHSIVVWSWKTIGKEILVDNLHLQNGAKLFPVSTKFDDLVSNLTLLPFFYVSQNVDSSMETIYL